VREIRLNENHAWLAQNVQDAISAAGGHSEKTVLSADGLVMVVQVPIPNHLRISHH
jgi:hypothetical protein